MYVKIKWHTSEHSRTLCNLLDLKEEEEYESKEEGEGRVGIFYNRRIEKCERI